MTTRYFGKPIRRNEDPRLLTGQALFVDDVHLPDMLHMAVLRSDYAHARIVGIDLAEAKTHPDVVAIYTADDLAELNQPGPLIVPPPPIERLTFHTRTQRPLAIDTVRHVGEAIAIVIAKSRYAAEDALEDIFVEYEALDPVVDIRQALHPDAPLVHPDLESNLASHVIQEKGDYERARTQGTTVIKRSFAYDRGTAAALENRGIVAHWDDKNQHLKVWDTTQAPIPVRNGLAAAFSLAESQVQVVAPFIGGGFGPKIFFYPEELLVPWVSMKLKCPIKWIEDRRENFFATTQERGQFHEAELALDEEGQILGVKDVFLHDTGAYDPYGLTVPINTQCTLLGPYNIPNYYSEFTVAFTNKPIVTPYRGAGRQHGVFVMERLLDAAARELNMDRIEIRKKNYLTPERFPHNHELIYQDFAPLVYDSGNYAPVLNRASELIDFRHFLEEEQPRLRAEGKHVGIGIVSYVEGTGIGPYEGARVTVEASGTVSVAMGVGTQGQGHFTSFAQVVAEQLGVPVEKIRIVTGDTRQFHWGTGTFASRGAVVAGSACHLAARQVRSKILKLASQQLEVDEEDLDLADGQVFIKGAPHRSISLGTLSSMANPLRGAVKPGTEPGLEATSYFGPERGSTANGVHAMIIEVDPTTMMIDIKKYVVVHDCGKVINPMILEGQMHGGVAQGIGNAFYEQLHFDEQGQLLNASFMDYLLPTATDVPFIETDHFETPSPLNPLGVKGAGEAGAIPVGALFAQAIEDAFPDLDLVIKEMPLSPNRLFEILQEAKQRRE